MPVAAPRRPRLNAARHAFPPELVRAAQPLPQQVNPPRRLRVPIAGRQIMHEYYGQHIGRRSRARRIGLMLAWLALLAALAVAAATVVIAAYLIRAGIR